MNISQTQTKRVLVTGASGFVGRHALPTLAEKGYEIHAISLNRQLTEIPAVWHSADLLIRSSIAELLKTIRPTHLLHFAWYTEHGKFWNSPENVRWVEATLALVSMFVQSGGKRAVIAGTCAEYDWNYGLCTEEITPLSPCTLYGTCKNACRQITTAYANQVNLSLAWGRIFFPYGPCEKGERLVPSVIQALLKENPISCTHGNQFRDFIFVQDAADAFVELLESEVVGPVNIGSGQPTKIKEVVKLLVELVGGTREDPVRFGAITPPPNDPPFLIANVGRISNEVGWKPRWQLREGLLETVRKAM
jgi:nucleoside-diphosphate-sugar epimerase